ncbi:MAG: imidazolonepropionase [Chloroflexota bacterium]
MTLRLIEGGRGNGDAPGLLVHGASQVVTLAGGLRRGPLQGALALLDAADVGGPGSSSAPVVACWEGKIVGVGPRDRVEQGLEMSGYPLSRFVRLDADGGVVTPGLVDPHTHLLFAGTREQELVMRQRGAGYMEILAAGGGILSTVAATRAASAEQLAQHGRRWLDEMVRHGVTTIEAKSGYGLDLVTELRLLEVAEELGSEGPVDVVPTFLGAHAVPPEYRARPDGTEAYVRHVIEEQLPGVAAQGRARSCDVFCEQGVFTADQSRRILTAAKGYGLAIRLHADELAPSGGAELAAELGALSADHLHVPSDEGLAAMAAAATGPTPTVATLLPATTWFLMTDEPAPARRFIDAGVPVALGTDFNPGTSPTASLPLVMTVACLAMKLSPAEALAAVTINAAHAVGVADRAGSLEQGKDADLVVWRASTVEQLPYWVGADLADVVVKRGRVVHRRAS